ncbi:hypothetical protein NT6N_11570 [Oceaniferula spumae]|uniref:DUF393 domain-containing protein n=1 Tax=Oceaniferula spumae TaxID=2979115 RepID=A0AAT9FJJ9_9BACT
MSPSDQSPNNILFLDGDCMFCQQSATMLHRLDKRGRLHFAPLQGETARILPEAWRQLEDTNNQASGAAVLTEYYGSDRQMHWRGADAILRSLYLTGGIFKIFWPLHWLPRWIKSPAYQFIARHRHRLKFGKESCSLPDAKFREHMLP